MIGEAADQTGDRNKYLIFQRVLFSIAAFKREQLTLRTGTCGCQPILLVDGRMVVSVSPQEGFLPKPNSTHSASAGPKLKCKLN